MCRWLHLYSPLRAATELQRLQQHRQRGGSHSGRKLMVGSAVVADEVRIASQPHHSSKGMLTNMYIFCE